MNETVCQGGFEREKRQIMSRCHDISLKRRARSLTFDVREGIQPPPLPGSNKQMGGKAAHDPSPCVTSSDQIKYSTETRRADRGLLGFFVPVAAFLDFYLRSANCSTKICTDTDVMI